VFNDSVRADSSPSCFFGFRPLCKVRLLLIALLARLFSEAKRELRNYVSAESEGRAKTLVRDKLIFIVCSEFPDLKVGKFVKSSPRLTPAITASAEAASFVARAAVASVEIALA